MPTRKAIVQYIDQLYSLKLDEDEFKLRVARLKKLGKIVPSLLFELISKADFEKKQFLFAILSEIGDDHVITRLREFITDPNETDETKLLAAVAVYQIGGYLDFWVLEDNLSNPQVLGKKIIENMLQKADEPWFIKVFLENFPGLIREGQFAALDDFATFQGDKRVVNFLGPLSEIIDDELNEVIIPILVDSHDRRAFQYLQKIIKRSDSKLLQNMARQAIFKLGTYIDDSPLLNQNNYQFHQAYASTCDGSGSSIYVFAVKDKDQKIRCIDFVNNDLDGIKDSFGGIFSTEDFDRFTHDLKSQRTFLMIQTPAAFIFEKAKAAEELMARLKRKLPVEYLAFRDILTDFDQDNSGYQETQQKFTSFRENVLHQKDEIFSETMKLYDFDEVRNSWFIDFELMAKAIEKYISIELKANSVYSDKTQKEIDRLFSQTAKRLFKIEFLTLMAERLNEYALLCFIGKKNERAKLAIVSAETLFDCLPDQHPFLRKMLDHSFFVHLTDDSESLLFDDDIIA